MSEPLILSGKDVSQSVYQSLLNRISSLKDQNITPGLAVVIVGDFSNSPSAMNPSSTACAAPKSAAQPRETMITPARHREAENTEHPTSSYLFGAKKELF